MTLKPSPLETLLLRNRLDEKWVKNRDSGPLGSIHPVNMQPCTVPSNRASEANPRFRSPDVFITDHNVNVFTRRQHFDRCCGIGAKSARLQGDDMVLTIHSGSILTQGFETFA